MNISKILNRLKFTKYSPKKNTFDIHGSCVSRDIFNYDHNMELILGKYIARTSFVSAITESFPLEIDLDIASPWSKRMAELDLKKNLFKILSVDSANYLLLDFIDERLPLIKYKKSINTFTDDLKFSNFSNFFELDEISKFSLEKSFWKRSMREYLKNLLKIYNEDKIIIHETYFVDSYLTGSGKIQSYPESQIEYNEKINKLLEEYYNYVKTKLPDANVLYIIDNYNLAYENHIWGNYPIHYVDNYYKHAVEVLKSIISDK